MDASVPSTWVVGDRGLGVQGHAVGSRPTLSPKKVQRMHICLSKCGSLSQKDLKFKINLGYLARLSKAKLLLDIIHQFPSIIFFYSE